MSDLNKKLLSVILVVSIVSLLFLGEVQAATITPGVNPGEIYDYHISGIWSSTDQYQSIPAYLMEDNKTSHVELRISTVNSTHITTFVAVYYTNGTYFGDRGSINLLTGESYGPYAAIAIIGANLNAGDLIHPDGTDGVKITDSVTKNYESGSRATNHIRKTDTNQTTGISVVLDQYFDKATGVLVEEVVTTTDSATSSTIVEKRVLASTSIEGWVVPEFPVFIAVPLFMAATAFVVLAFKKKHLFVKL